MLRTLAVIGAGQMGTGIAHTAALVANIPKVVLFDRDSATLARHLSLIGSLLARDVAKSRISESDRKSALSRIAASSTLHDLADADFVVEAVSEAFDVKRALFQQLAKVLKSPDAIVATNTSSISITKLASVCGRPPSHFIGMHFMNPVPVMKLVEVIRGCATAESTLQATLKLAHAMGKTTTIAQDVPGFIANRLLMPYINEAVFALYEGIATRDDIDKTMVLGTNVPMGPLRLADLIGLDTCLAIMSVLHTELGDSKYRPCPLLVRHVNANWLGIGRDHALTSLGRKSGKGFYEYTSCGTQSLE